MGPTEPYEALASDAFDELDATRGHGVFISTFCKPDSFGTVFTNILGGFTPCFCDVVLLGICQFALLGCGVLRLYDLRDARGAHFRKYQVIGWRRKLHRAGKILCCLAAAIPLLQLNGRLAEVTFSHRASGIAPFEMLGYIVGFASYVVAAVVINVEMDVFVPERTWLLRMPLVASFAAQLAKLRGVVLILNDRGKTYFFWLFVALTAIQGLLAVWAIVLGCPSMSGLQLPWGSLSTGYEELPPTEYAVAIASSTEVCPEFTSNVFSQLSFSWLTPLMRKGYAHPLEFNDIWELPPPDKVKEVHNELDRNWRKQLETGQPSLSAAAWKTTASLFITALPFKLMNDASQFVGPVFLNLLLSSITRNDPPARSYLYAIGMFAGLILGCVCEGQYWQRSMRAGFRLRAAVVAAVYRKILVLTSDARAAYSRGFIYNLVTSDADNLQQLCNQAFALLSSPIRIVVAMVLLYSQLGVAAFAALILLILVIPIQMKVTRMATGILNRGMTQSDERTKLESDVVTGIEAVKTQAWETFFSERVTELRARELDILWEGFKLSALNTLILQTIPTLVTIATFSLYVILGNTLTATKAFTALSLFSVLRFPLFQLPMVVSFVTRAQVALGRLKEFMCSAERDPTDEEPAQATGGVAVHMRGTITWAREAPPVLHNVDFMAQAGDLVVIVGATGSGKTTFLNAVLGLTEVMEDSHLSVRGRVAYVAQQAYIFGGTVQDNILFDLDWSAGRYERAVAAASLHADLEQLPAGDQTELGEGGINVSGGQKQRIQIARAVYANPSVVLLDDPLSALDSKVGRAVFRKCIQGELAGTTRLLVTNQLQYVSEADHVVVLKDGGVAESGRFKALMAAGGVLTAMMQDVQKDEAPDDPAPDSSQQSNQLEGISRSPSTGTTPVAQSPVAPRAARHKAAKSTPASVRHAMSRSRHSTPLVGVSAMPSTNSRRPPRATDPNSQPRVANSGTLTSSETRAHGVVSGDVLMAYARALGGLAVFAQLISLYVLIEGVRVSASVWLSVWTASGEDASDEAASGLQRVLSMLRAEHVRGTVIGRSHGPMFFLSIFCAISVLQVLLAVVAQFQMRWLSLRAATRLHAQMLNSLLYAPLSFFHTHPSGRIINRLTKDTNDIDRNLATFASSWFNGILQLLSTAAVVGAVTPFVLPCLVPVLLAFGLLYLYFQASVREVKRLDALARSPIFTAVGNTLTGLATIRSFRREAMHVERMARLIDGSSVMQLLNQSANRWLSIRLESIGALVSFAAAALAIEQRGAAAWAGLTLSYALQLTSLTTMTVRLSSLAENSFNAVERVDEYSHLTPEGAKEPPADGAAPFSPREGSGNGDGDSGEAEGPEEPPEGWPAQGRIEFKEARMRYRPGLPLVLRGLSFTIPAGNKVGIVGRTGAGKSSIINALFRLAELDSGAITIDGVDIAHLPLRALRAKMALIPQLPVLFNGTLRANLDPVGERTEPQLWRALEDAHLASMVQAHPDGLDMRLVEGGSPLAAGQRQLVALARALLKRSRVIVLDEATANVDMETDQLIQHTIREEFAASTCISVAHRLHTVIDYDKILVMDAGVAAEYNTPKELLANKGGVFTSMVNETGRSTAKMLRSVAGGATTMRDTRAALAKSASRTAAQRAPNVNGLQLTQQIVRDTKEADALLQSLVQIMEDQEQTERMVRQYADNGSEDAAARAQTIADVAANLSSVSQLMRTVKQRLDLMQQVSAVALEGLTVTPRTPSGAPDASAGNSARANFLTPRRGTPSMSGEPSGASVPSPGPRAGGGGGGAGPGASSPFSSIAEPSGKWTDAVDKVRVMQRASARFMVKRGKDQSQSRVLADVGSGDLGM